MTRNRLILALLVAAFLAGWASVVASQSPAREVTTISQAGSGPAGSRAVDPEALQASTWPAKMPVAAVTDLAESGMKLQPQGLATNGDFATNLAGWTVSGAGEAAWSTLDVDARSDSGSAQLTSREVLAGQEHRVYPLTLCIDVTQAGRYFIGGSGRLASGQGSGRLVFSYFARPSDDCSGGASAVGGRFLSSVDSWSQAAAELIVFDPPGSVEIRLGIEKDTAGGELHGNFDDVYLLLDEGVFADGFE